VSARAEAARFTAEREAEKMAAELGEARKEAAMAKEETMIARAGKFTKTLSNRYI